MRLGMFPALLLIFPLLADSNQLGTAGGSVRMSLETRDLILGELSVMGDGPIKLTVTNHGVNAVRIPTGNSSRWMAASPYWTIHIDGPVDGRCEEYAAVAVGFSAVGVEEHVVIGGGEKKEFELPGLGIGQEGEYRLWVEYKGDLAAEGFLTEVSRTDEVVLRIRPPGATEQEVVQAWRKQNPDAPWCLFPTGMIPDLLETTGLIEQYPTSLYAGWQLWKRLQSHTGGFPGKPSAANPADFVRAARESRESVLYDERVHTGAPREQASIRGENAAAWRIERIERFLSAHPDFPQAHEMMLRVAMDYIGLGKYQKAERELGKIIGSWPQSAAANRAAAYLSLLRRQSGPTKQRH